MKQWIRIGIVAAVGALALPLDSFALAPQECERAANVVRRAGRLGAEEDFFIAIAHCLNDPGSNLLQCIADARDEYLEELDLVDEQYVERLAVCALVGHGPYDPQLDPKDFSFNITSKYLPQKVGRTLVYEHDTEDEEVRVTALKETITIDGIECRQVRDVVLEDDEVVEDTLDWFAQNKNGDVWYMGEIALNYEEGMLTDIEGSWRSGVDGAKPGVLIRQDPKVGDTYRQEYLIDEAEDVAQVVALGQSVKVPAGTFHNCLQTLEWSPLEPGHSEYKYYAPGVGLVLEVDIQTGGRLELVEIID